MQSIMTFHEVQKHFQSVKALDGVSFEIPENSIFGLLGPNGAGKTTLIRIITKILMADSGTIHFKNKPIQLQDYAAIGYMPEEKGMYKKMRVGEHLIYLARLKGLSKAKAKERIQFWLEKLDAADWWQKKIEDLSKGMQQKVQFIATVLHEPELLILDEPFSGLDPVNADMIKNEIYELHKNGTTILFSTHRMEQVEEICKNIVLINKGKVVTDGEVTQIKNRFKEHVFKVHYAGEHSVTENALFTILEQTQNHLFIKLHEGTSNNMALQYLIQHGEVDVFSEELPTLHDIFIQLVKTKQGA